MVSNDFYFRIHLHLLEVIVKPSNTTFQNLVLLWGDFEIVELREVKRLRGDSGW